MGTVGSIVVHFNLWSRKSKERAPSFDIFEPRPLERVLQPNDAAINSCYSQSPLLRK